MMRHALALLGLLVLVAGCTMQAPSQPTGAPRSLCMEPPQRSQNYTSDRPLFYFMCAESP